MENMETKTNNERIVKPHKNGMAKEQKIKIIAYFFILPAILFFLLLIAYPLLTVIWDSFHFKNLLNKALSGFAALDNYKAVIHEETFQKSLENTGVWTVLSVVGEYVLGIISALALNQKIRARGLFRGIIIIPWVVPIVVAGMTWSWLLAPDYGIVNIWMTKLGMLDKPYFWLGELKTALLTVTFVNIWRSFPFYTISLLAALQSVPRDIIEAAALDGAGVWQRFYKIVLPQLKPVSLVLIFVHIISTAINFDFIWVMTQGGPFNSTQTLPIMIYRYAMQQFDVGSASALASMMLGFMLCMFFLYYYFSVRKNRV
jgi:multiple sugar transport system permease protein